MATALQRIAIGTVLTVVGAAALSAAYQSLGERADQRQYPPPGDLIDVGAGHRLHLWREGQGDPSVILIAALGTGALEWAGVQQALSSKVRAYVYDRGGLGWSDLPPGPRTICELSDELARLLTAADVPVPSVLVGHSVGGVIARDFATRHPKGVGGLILVDSSHEQMWDRLPGREGKRSAHVRRAVRRRLTWLGLMRALYDLGIVERSRTYAERAYPSHLVDAGLAVDLTSRQRRARIGELLAMDAGFGEAFAGRKHLGDLPLTVLTAGPEDANIDPKYSALRRQTYDSWLDLQTEFVALADGSAHRVVEESGHHMHLDVQDIIVAETLAMCQRVRDEPRDHGDGWA